MRKFIPVEESFRKWEIDPAFRRAYEALEDEFSQVAALIEAQANPEPTQEQVTLAIDSPIVATLQIERH